MMFDFASSSPLSGLDEETRLKLADIIDRRCDLAEKMIVMNRMKSSQLRNPQPDGDERITDFSSTVIAPLRDSIAQDVRELLEKAIDLDQLKSMLPMFLMALLQNVNVPLALTAVGVDADQLALVMSKIKDAISDLR